MKLFIIVAIDKNGLIGNDDKLPWSLPADLKYFKQTTIGYPIIMGRKTYESIGKPLPGRENIILTRDQNYKAEGCTIFHNEKLLDVRSDVGFVIGGSEIFKLFLDRVDKLFITKINDEFEGNIYFPKINEQDWKSISEVKGIKDEKNLYDYSFNIYERINKKRD